MKVRFSLPIKGKLRVADELPVKLQDWSFDFITSEDTGFVDQLVIEIANVPKENWPTMTTVEQDPNAERPTFPFAVNPDAYQFKDFEPQIVNLESYLSVYGLEEICLRNLSVDWLPEENDEIDSGFFAGFSISHEPSDPRCGPLNNLYLAKCIVASNTAGTDAAALAHFRTGQTQYHERRYIDAIRSLYLCIESLFANNKTGERETLNEFRKSIDFTKAIQTVLLDQPPPSLIKIRDRYKALSTGLDVDSILQFIFHLRGQVMHANAFKQGKWHPSRQMDFENEAICVINVVEEICWNIAERDIEAVKRPGNASD